MEESNVNWKELIYDHIYSYAPIYFTKNLGTKLGIGDKKVESIIYADPVLREEFRHCRWEKGSPLYEYIKSLSEKYGRRPEPVRVELDLEGNVWSNIINTQPDVGELFGIRSKKRKQKEKIASKVKRSKYTSEEFLNSPELIKKICKLFRDKNGMSKQDICKEVGISTYVLDNIESLNSDIREAIYIHNGYKNESEWKYIKNVQNINLNNSTRYNNDISLIEKRDFDKIQNESNDLKGKRKQIKDELLKIEEKHDRLFMLRRKVELENASNKDECLEKIKELCNALVKKRKQLVDEFDNM